jgi:glycosyltransferase involved in cell wall biosynthesis
MVIDELAITPHLCQLQTLLASLPEGCYELHVAATAGDKVDSAAYFDSSIRFHRLDSTPLTINQIKNLRRIIRDLRPDVVHAWGHQVHLISLLASWRLTPRRPVISYFEYPAERPAVASSVEFIFRRQCADVTASHRVIARYLVQKRLHAQVRVVPNSVPVSGRLEAAAARRKLIDLIQNGETETGQLVLIGAVAGFEHRYRLKDLVWANDLLCRIRRDVHLFIFGSGSSRALRTFISNTESERNIHLLPPGAADPSSLYGLDIFWNGQTQHPNPAPMLLAMCNRIPVVSTLAAETAESVLPMRTALATNYGARDEFARWTKFLLEQQHSARNLVEQSQKFVERSFPIETMVGAFREIYARYPNGMR